MKLTEFEIKLDDLMYDINAEMMSLNQDNPEEEDQYNQLFLLKDALNDAHSELMDYQRQLTKYKKQYQ